MSIRNGSVVRVLCSPLLWCATLVLFAHGCKGTETTAPPPPTTGDLVVAATTTGIDVDPDGYTVALDSGLFAGTKSLAVNGTVTFPQLGPGTHSVSLLGSTSNCLVAGDTRRTASIIAG